MPTPKDANRVEVAALRSLFDDSIAPPFTLGIDYVVNLVNYLYPDYIAHLGPGIRRVECQYWSRHKQRVQCSNFGRAGDLLLWMPSPAFPEGSAGVCVRAEQTVLSSPNFTFTPAGRLLIKNVAFTRRPDIVIRLQQ